MRRALRHVCAAAVVLLTAALAHALVGRDRTQVSIWGLVQHADLIAVVQADGHSVVEGADPSSYVGLEHVRVLEQLKGTRAQRLVITEPGPRWTDGVHLSYSEPEAQEPVSDRAPELVFLEPAVKGVAYRSPLFGGQLEFEESAELAAFRQWVARAISLQAEHGPDRVPAEKRRGWLVQGASGRATRGYALQLLGMEALTREERRRLMQGFVREPTTDLSFYKLLRLVEDEPDAAFDRIATGVLQTVFDEAKVPRRGGIGPLEPPEGPPRWTLLALPILMKRLGFSEQEQVQVTGRSDRTLFPSAANVEAAWSKFRKHPRAPAAAPLPSASSPGSSGPEDAPLL
jgi:hypothetical protein